MLDKIISYLAQGFTHLQVSDMVGCGEDYVSKISRDVRYTELIAAEKLRLKAVEVDVKLEKSYASLEEATLKQIKESMPFAEFRDLTRTMEVLIRRKQQDANHNRGITVNNTQVNTVVLSIPQAAVPDIVLNGQKEVIAIGNKSLAPLQSAQVRSLFDVIEKKRQEAAELTKAIEKPKQKHHHSSLFTNYFQGSASGLDQEVIDIPYTYDVDMNNRVPEDF